MKYELKKDENGKEICPLCREVLQKNLRGSFACNTRACTINEIVLTSSIS